ncbi:hypothetical protein ADN00_07890 [Ornatilinea apprima]|uniref:Uncharacterized protein n=1 Tax=Ornatilinea apprima TaxID=1134406 RepID=A0A0P6XEK4_9CHLR|nr:hypothetical protein [Ornatilinea apprima]KPL78087.1 hypothetical protein ADN00_07890 [Ornatilinea apprima]
MESLNNILDNREIAIIIWLGVFFVWALSQKKIRKSFVKVFKTFAQKVIFISSILMVLYIGTMIYLLHRINLWNISYLSDTIIWILGVAFVLFVNISHAREDDYFRKAVVDNIKLVVFIEFITDLYVFNLWVELILVPVLALLGALLGAASARPEFKRVESLLAPIVGLIGVGFLAYAIYNMIVDFGAFLSMQNLLTLLMPLILTILFLPFVYVLAVYVVYDSIFMRIKKIVANPKLANYAKWQTLFAFHLNLKALNKWLRKVVVSKLESREAIKQAILSVKMSGA